MTRHRFLSTLSLRRATDHNTTVAGYDPDFYPRSPCGERPHRCHLQPGDRHFYPRSPCGERQVLPTAKRLMQQFLSTLSLRRATGACSKYAKYGWVFLSTLSLRRATFSRSLAGHKIQISIHALLAESDLYPDRQNPERAEFLSTLSLRRATWTAILEEITIIFLSTLSLRRATDFEPSTTRRLTFLSTLSLRRATGLSYFYIIKITYFYPRSPCGERPRAANCQQRNHQISIHALLAESDSLWPFD